MIDFYNLLLFIIPAYIANGAPVLLGGGTPLDLGIKWGDGERILGDRKTIRGFIGGVAAGVLVAGLLALYYPSSFFANSTMQLFAGIAMSFGTLIGDALGSFIKRRQKVEGGKPFFLDSALFLILALAFAYPFTLPTTYNLELITILLIVTLILHPLTNFLAHHAGLKNVPW